MSIVPASSLTNSEIAFLGHNVRPAIVRDRLRSRVRGRRAGRRPVRGRGRRSFAA